MVGDITDWITHTAQRPTRVAGLGLENDFYGCQLLIHKLVTATVTAAIADIITAATTITAAAIAAAGITATIDTARRRSTAGRRRRRNPDLAATASASIRDRTVATGNKEVGCFGLGGNGGGSECESCHGHDRYPA
jgi:hypothetical protein